MQCDNSLAQKQPKEIWQQFGYEQKGYDLTSFRQGLNRIKKELLLNPTMDDIEDFDDDEGKLIFIVTIIYLLLLFLTIFNY